MGAIDQQRPCKHADDATGNEGQGPTDASGCDAACAEAGVRALHLEVERHKDNARGLYRRWGFVEHDRVLMTKPIGR